LQIQFLILRKGPSPGTDPGKLAGYRLRLFQLS
jgi:hypothetical protein